jgi:hypothetical protein|tara:strand:+ start:108 stop:314 length:207 start_codon:yes stop_codon:yes gene_type:complete
MTSSTQTNSKIKGIIKSKSLVDLLVKKTQSKKELILLKKNHEDIERQEELTEEISAIEKFLSKHRIQK